MSKFFTSLKIDFKKNRVPCVTGFIIPFIYMLLSLAEYIYTYPVNDPTYHPIVFTSYCAVCVFLPLLMVFMFVDIDEWFKNDKFPIAQTIRYMAVWSWIFALFYLFIGIRIAELLIPIIKG